MKDDKRDYISNLAVGRRTKERLKYLCEDNGIKMIFLCTGLLEDFLIRVEQDRTVLNDFIATHGKSWGKKNG